LDACTFEAEAGELLAVVGANGSGKSTLLTLLAGLYSPSDGRIVLDGVESPGQERSLRRQTGLLFQEADLQILGASVAEDLALAGKTAGRPSAERVAELADRFGLEGLMSRAVQQLSGGEKRKLCLAGMLLRRPLLLLLDEPFSGLDYPSVRELRRHLAENKGSGLTQIVATHDVEPVLDLSDRCLVLHHGKLRLQGRPEEVLDRFEDFGVRQPCLWRSQRVVGCWDGRVPGQIQTS